MGLTTPTTSSSGGEESLTEDSDTGSSEELLLGKAAFQLKNIQKMTDAEKQTLLLNTIQKG